MIAHERLQIICERVAEEGTISVRKLQTALRIAPATLRRDLVVLERQQRIIRTHGGAMHPATARKREALPPRHAPAKAVIGHAAGEMVPDGATVFIDCGQTCLECGKSLLGRSSLRIVTHSLPLLALSMHAEARVISLGGELHRTSGAFLGMLSESWLGKMRPDYIFLGASALDARAGAGVMDFHDGAIKEQLLSFGTKRYLLAESSKLEHSAALYYAPWQSFDAWITDAEPEQKVRDTKIVVAE